MEKFKHLTFTQRLRIETLTNAKHSPKEIAVALHVHVSTVYRELRRGTYEHLNSDYTTELRYSPDIAEEQYRGNLAAKGVPLKIGSEHALATYIENKIIAEKFSPAAALAKAAEDTEASFSVRLSVNTLYSYIDKGVFLRLTNKDLPMRSDKKRPYHHVKPARPPKGESIESRPEEVTTRETFGHWEMDTVVGRKGTKGVLLVLTERLTRKELIRPLKDRTTASIVAALDTLERKFGKLFRRVFQTITVDNGSEFQDCDGMQSSCTVKKNRTKLFYCHPYSSWERGSNEKQNQMIRRHFPKKTIFTGIKRSAVAAVEDWLNNYPRALLGWKTADQLFNSQLAMLS